MSDEKKTKLLVQIPDEIIRNSLFSMNANTFSVYVLLKFLLFRNYNESPMQLDHNILKHKLYISDNRTLKRIFKILHENQFILEYINKLPTRGHMSITFDPIPFESQKFTQLPVTIINKVEHIGTIGMRLLFYYESYINRKDMVDKHYAFPAMETISEHLGIDQETIIKYNNILKKQKLLRVIKHELKPTGDYDEFDKILFTKYNNHYYVRLKNF